MVSSSKSSVVDEKSTPTETKISKVSGSVITWNIVKKKRSPRKIEKKKQMMNKRNLVYEGTVNEIKSFAKDEKEEQQFLELADFLYFIRDIKTVPKETITEIKRKYGKAEDVDRISKVEPRPLKKSRKEHQMMIISSKKFSDGASSSKGVVDFMSYEKPNCPIFKRKVVQEKGKSSVAQKDIHHKKLVLEAERREENPPLVVLHKMEKMNGSSLKFLMEKNLLDTDMSKGHDRLSMPKLQVAREFLNEEEIDGIKRGCIDVQVVEPCGLETRLKLTKWKSGSEVYVLRLGWRDIAKREENGLDSRVKVQIWCFRMENNQLCFQIVKANDDDKGSVSGGIKKHTPTKQIVLNG